MRALQFLRHPLAASALLLCGATAFGAQPGESITLDPATGNYTVTYCNPNGAPPAAGTCALESFVFVPSTKIVPLLRSRFAVNGGAFQFTYGLANGAASGQAIAGLALEPVSNVIGAVPLSQVNSAVDDATLATALDSWAASMTNPAGWQGDAVVADSGTAMRTAWLNQAAADPKGGLPPGKAQLGFGFASADLPGLGMAQISGNPGPPLTFNDDGPTGDIGAQLETLEAHDYVTRLAALPAIPIPAPFDRAQLLQAIDTQVASWVGLRALDPVLYNQIHGILQAAIAAANQNDLTSCKAQGVALQRVMLRIYAALNPADDSQDDAPASPLIARLAARVLVFDVLFAIVHR